MIVEFRLDDRCVQFTRSLPVHVVDAVVHGARGWRKARNPSNAVTAALRRHHVVMSGNYKCDGRSSW
eukprot:10462537-Alexandrium_andersonii.AAC.1